MKVLLLELDIEMLIDITRLSKTILQAQIVILLGVEELSKTRVDNFIDAAALLAGREGGAVNGMAEQPCSYISIFGA